MSTAKYEALREQISGVAMVLHSAEAIGLPTPSIVGSLDGSSTVVLHLRHRADFDLWADWTDAQQIDTLHKGDSVEATGESFELPLRLLWLDPARTRVPAPVAS